MAQIQSINRARAAAVKRGRRFDRPRERDRNSRWTSGEFVAVDGEGFSEGNEYVKFVGAHKNVYRGKEHFYAYLAASDGSELYAPKRLSLFESLEFLVSIVVKNPRAILVAFGGSYDVTQMMAHDLTPAQIKRLLGKGPDRNRLYVSDDTYAYALEYRPRKCLTISRWPAGARRWTVDKRGRKVSTPHLTVRLWDVWGFFQGSFVEVMRKWLPGDADYEMIKREKANRAVFERAELATIKRYNAAELRCLVKIMDKVRDAIGDLSLKITRWDGAGAIAAAMLAKHDVKSHKGELPPDVFEAARRAYSGGHIEACKVGYHAGEIHHYDVNSAYPDQFRKLPSLADGKWISGTGEPPPGYTLVKVRYAFSFSQPFYPLFHRSKDGAIIYPSFGCGWFWYPEFEAGSVYWERIGGAHYEIMQWFHFDCSKPERPFQWLEDYYSIRQKRIELARRAGIEDGPEKVLKLGYNALYGKTAQQVGARIDEDGQIRLPPYFQLDWAGYVTAGCRAKLMVAAIDNPHAIIAFATDGLFSTARLNLTCPTEKTLGDWEYTKHAGITVVMPGVYWLHEKDEIQHYSRGFDKEQMSDPAFIHAAWRAKQETVPIKLRRLVGLGSAVMSADFWEMRGAFVQATRSLRLDGDNSKRYAINLARDRPHLGLVDTIPREHFLPNLLGVEESAPYPIAWLDGGEVSRDLLEGELADELEAMDAELA